MSSKLSSLPLSKPGAVRLWSTLELIKMPPPTWQIENMIPNGAMVGLYAPPDSYKSFLAMDFVLCVGSGKPWNGRKVQKGTGLYIAAEGGHGIGKRAKAWLQHHSIKPTKADVMWMLESVPIYGDSDEIDAVFDRLLNEVERKPNFVVIDTLARCFDGDENKQEDMGRFIQGADRFRRQFDATVLIIHHPRLDGDRERGNTAFRGAADTMLKITRQGENGQIVLKCDKQKDAEGFGMIGLRFKAIEDTDSGVLVPTKANPQDQEQKEQEILRVLAGEPEGLTYSDLFTQVEEFMSLATMKRNLLILERNGLIRKMDGLYFGS